MFGFFIGFISCLGIIGLSGCNITHGDYCKKDVEKEYLLKCYDLEIDKKKCKKLIEVENDK
jgi:hypothetical protein